MMNHRNRILSHLTADLKSLLLEIVMSQVLIIEFIFDGQLLGNRPINENLNAAPQSEIFDIMEHDSDELMLSEVSGLCIAEVFSVVLHSKQSKLCVRLLLLNRMTHEDPHTDQQVSLQNCDWADAADCINFEYQRRENILFSLEKNAILIIATIRMRNIANFGNILLSHFPTSG